MARKGENIFKRKDGRWEARYIRFYENGKAHYRFLYGHTYYEAKSKKRTEQSLDFLGRGSVPLQHVTIDELAKLWLADVRASVKESTYTRYFRMVDKYITPLIGHYDISKFDSVMLNQFTDSLLRDGGRGRPLSSKTVADIIYLIKQIIKFARYNGYSLREIEYTRNPQRSGKKVEVFSSTERRLVEIVTLQSWDKTSLGIFIALFTGIRIGELCGLKWGDIDFNEGVISINRTIERISDLDDMSRKRTKVVVAEPKTSKSQRIIPLPSFVMEHLYKFRGPAESYIITGRSIPTEPHCFYMRYKNFLQKYELGNYTFHALRHTFATMCIEAGFDTKSLSEILGHSNVSTTMGIYVHPTLEQKREHMEKLNPRQKRWGEN